MKRSEVVNLIVDSSSNYIPKRDAERILAALEKCGMLPPSKKMDYKELQAVNHCVADKFEYFHQWDAEEENDEIPF